MVAVAAGLKWNAVHTGAGVRGAPNELSCSLLVGKAGFTPGRDVTLAIDAAASEFYAVISEQIASC